MAWHLRLADRPDLAAIPKVELEAASLFPESDLPLHLRHKVTRVDELGRALDDARLWVAINDDGKVVGYAMADFADGEAYLVEVDVLPSYGRRGIGTGLVRMVAEWAEKLGKRELRLITFRHLPWNAPFYERIGFESIEIGDYGPEMRSLFEEEKKVGLNVKDRVAMRLRL